MMIIKPLQKLAVGVIVAVGLSAHAAAEVVPHIITGFITEGVEPRQTSGSYAGDIGTLVAMNMSVDFDPAGATSTESPEPGVTIYNFDAAPYWNVAYFYDPEAEYEAMESGYEASGFRLTHADDVDLTGRVLGGETLSGTYDIVELAFETVGGRGPDVETEHGVSLIGDSNWLQNGGPQSLFDADYLTGYWQDQLISSGEVVGFAHLEIAGVDVLGDEELAPEPVPLPASAWLFLSALMGVAGVARYRGKTG